MGGIDHFSSQLVSGGCPLAEQALSVSSLLLSGVCLLDGGGSSSLLLGLLLHLVLSLNVVLGQVAVLAHTVRVVGLVGVAASVSHLGLTHPMVAVVAHVLGVVLFVRVRALVDFSPLPLPRRKW